MMLHKPFKTGDPVSHIETTRRLAQLLEKRDVYEWLVKTAYYPEPYVLPPCFEVSKVHPYGSPIFGKAKKNYKPVITDPLSIQFPKTELTDRKFGIIDPRIHADIAYWLSSNWLTVVGRLLNKNNKVCCYSFPVPLDIKTPGKVGKLRSGRSIYEFIEMAENDLAAIAYRYKFIICTDVKNFYPSIYTHSLAWSMHGKSTAKKNRYDYSLVGNRLDKLFQNSNDGCTNGIPIGSGVADVAAELVLSQVDLALSAELSEEHSFVVRFKDDYRILCSSEGEGKKILKVLQGSLKRNPNPKLFYRFARFKETYLAVVEIDRKCFNTGVIDRFLVDIVKPVGNKPNFEVRQKTLPQVISLLLMLGRLRTKAFPKVLAILELILRLDTDEKFHKIITKHLENLLEELCENPTDNCYLILWIVYFLKTNRLANPKIKGRKVGNEFVHSVFTSRNHVFKTEPAFTLFTPVMKASKKTCLLDHLAVFKPQEGA